jgi:hypothetical protein
VSVWKEVNEEEKLELGAIVDGGVGFSLVFARLDRLGWDRKPRNTATHTFVMLCMALQRLARLR